THPTWLYGIFSSSPNYTVVQQTTESDSDHPGEPETLQCSVLSDSENKTCSGDLSVFWFRTGSDKSHPDIIYTDGNRHDGCEKRSDNQKSCVYHFSKTFSSSDAGTYYCAVATCGQILFGNGTTLTNGMILSDGRRLFSRVALYMTWFIHHSHKCICPVQPQIIPDPPPCFTVRTRQSGLKLAGVGIN
uniref:Ig-like domain-containing protein n=1 Tax=Stegastes partitus TaxID=144197 RepID=A0A3B4ZAX4_9TELE